MALVVRIAVWGVAALLALTLLVWFRRSKKAGLGVAAAVVVAAVATCGGVQNASKMADRQAYFRVSDEFDKLCYERAFERIDRIPGHLSRIVMNPQAGPQGDYQFELFYGSGRPSHWGGIPVVPALTAPLGEHEEVAQISFEYEPVTIKTPTGDIIIHGVRIRAKDLRSGVSLGERVNFHWGDDFNRGTQCLGASWFGDNQAFLERLLGDRPQGYREFGGVGRANQRYINATLTRQDSEVHALYPLAARDQLPAGSEYDYNNRTIRLPQGSFKMFLYGNAEPVPIVASRDLGDQFAFVMLPGSETHNRSVRQLLLHYRKKTGEEVMNTIIQIPPGMAWRSGWGFDPSSVKLTTEHIEFSFSGDKIHDPEQGTWSELVNQGQYRKRYSFSAELPRP